MRLFEYQSTTAQLTELELPGEGEGGEGVLGGPKPWMTIAEFSRGRIFVLQNALSVASLLVPTT